MSYAEKYKEEVDAFVTVCHRLAQHLYVTAHGGNMAWKLEDNLILITPTRLNKGDVTPADIVFIDAAGRTVEGQHKPTGETPMYLNFFRERPDIASVIHSHPPLTGAFAITQGVNWLMRPVFPETSTEVGPVPLVPYAEPLTQRLADNFLPFLQKYNAFLMANHGLVIMTPRDITWTMMMTELLECTAASLLQGLALGPIKELTREDVENLDSTIRVRNLPMFGAPGVNQSLTDVYFDQTE